MSLHRQARQDHGDHDGGVSGHLDPPKIDHPERAA